MIEKILPINKSLSIEGFRRYIHNRISFFLKVILVIGAVMAFWQGQYQASIEILLILFVTLLPMLLSRRFRFRIPHIFEALAVIFIYMSLFMGEVLGYYERFWWWDSVLHVSSGVLLGILGFLLVYVLNEKEEIQLHLSPGFMALFAFMFAMGIGALWEIFEYAMDQIFGMNMQKNGLHDTMWDLIVDALGALVIAIFGWVHLKTEDRSSFLERWIDEFIAKNPRLFNREGAEESRESTSEPSSEPAPKSSTESS